MFPFAVDQILCRGWGNSITVGVGVFSEGFPGVEILECAELRVAVLPVQRIGAFIVPSLEGVGNLCAVLLLPGCGGNGFRRS